MTMSAALFAAAASSAGAADRVYWDNGTTISFANLDGSGGSDLNLTGATTVNGPFGLGVDSSTGRIYWVASGNFGAGFVSFANLDGSGAGGDLNTTGATMSTAEPGGAAIDPVARRIYWAGTNAAKISWASLDGGGGGDLTTTGATTTKALGLAVDPALGKVYWSDFGATNKIAFAKLDGSGGSDLNTTGATVSDPAGVAIDAATGKLYWANAAANTISFANLDGSGGGGDLATTGATVNDPTGVAIDPAAGKIYWANSAPASTDANTISWAKLDGSGGGNLKTTGATVGSASFPVLVQSPRGTGVPAITGGSTVGSVLSCGAASWAADLPGEFLYRAPHTTGFQWTLAGTDIAGATASTLTAFVPGSYGCRATASNVAGTAAQTSASHTVEATAPTPTTTPTPQPPLHMSGLRISPRKLSLSGRKVNGRCVTQTVRNRSKQSCRLAIKLKLTYRLNRADTVTLTFARITSGRKLAGKCVKPTAHNHKRKRCTRRLAIRGKITLHGKASVNSFTFNGTLAGHRLAPGTYRLTATPTGAKPQHITFTLTP
jgi:hypothetical protein